MSLFQSSTFQKLAVALSFSLISSFSLAAAPSKKEIVFGTTVGDFADMVTEGLTPVLKAKGYDVKLVEFTDYVLPNLSLADGSLDVNIFQHKPYLDNFIEEHKLKLTPIAQVPTGALGIYKGKLSSLDQVQEGSTVSMPNDLTNLARALVMLQELGWIKLKTDVNRLRATEADIAENTKGIKIVQLEAAQLPRSISDVDFAIINANYVVSSGMKLTEALRKEGGFTFVNWAVARTDDTEKPYIKDVIDALNSDEFKAYSAEKFAGYNEPEAWQKK